MTIRVPVDDPADPRLRDYVGLRDVQLRRLLEVQRGLFIAEGAKVIERAAAAGYTARSFLMTERWIEGLRPALDAASDVPLYVVSEQVAEQVTGFHVHRGALAAYERPEPLSPETVLADARRIVLLEDVNDHANVGAIMRSCAALGIDGVLLGPRCADPLYRRAVKVAMGAAFAMPWTRVDAWYDAVDDVRRRGFETVALTLDQDAVELGSWLVDRRCRRLCLVLGGEGHGLSTRWARSADVRATIPMTAGVDSLNVAAAAAIGCYLLACPGSGEPKP